MQTSVAATRVQLPLRSTVRASRTQRAAVSCMAAQQRRPQQQQQPPAEAAAEPTAAAALALSSLLLAAPAYADEAEAAAAGAAAAVAEGVFAPLGITLAGWALLASPLMFYAVFNLYRSQVDPRAKFGDAVFAFAAAILAANILSIVVFKIRLF